MQVSDVQEDRLGENCSVHRIPEENCRVHSTLGEKCRVHSALRENRSVHSVLGKNCRVHSALGENCSVHNALSDIFTNITSQFGSKQTMQAQGNLFDSFNWSSEFLTHRKKNVTLPGLY